MEITVEVQDISGKLFLTQEGGRGKWGKSEFQFYTTLRGLIILEQGQKNTRSLQTTSLEPFLSRL